MATQRIATSSSTKGDGRPIGIFDSGVGGLSVWIKIREQLPDESTLYFADQAHVPYGSRDILEIRNYSQRITEFLLNQGAKLIVVACNTASGAALQYLRDTFPQSSFVGMEPAVKPAVTQTRTGHVGVIATPTTFQGFLYQKLVQRFGRNVKIHTQVCPGLVDAIESGLIDTESTAQLLHKCLQPLKKHNIDQLVLGCTHYPFIIPLAERILGEDITLIDPAPAVARQTRRLLELKAQLNHNDRNSSHIFYTSQTIQHLKETAKLLVGYTGRIREVAWQDEYIDVNEHQNHIDFI